MPCQLKTSISCVPENFPGCFPFCLGELRKGVVPVSSAGRAPVNDGGTLQDRQIQQFFLMVAHEMSCVQTEAVSSGAEELLVEIRKRAFRRVLKTERHV